MADPEKSHASYIETETQTLRRELWTLTRGNLSKCGVDIRPNDACKQVSVIRTGRIIQPGSQVDEVKLHYIVSGIGYGELVDTSTESDYEDPGLFLIKIGSRNLLLEGYCMQVSDIDRDGELLSGYEIDELIGSLGNVTWDNFPTESISPESLN